MARKQGSHSDITGPRIRAAALRLIARHGYAAVSMRQIAGEVGVQVGALYNYVPDKQTLLFDLMRTHLEALLAAWAEEPKGIDPDARLEAFVRFHIRYHLPRPDAVFVAYMELRNLTSENFAAIEAHRRAYEDALESILIAGARDGRFQVVDTRVTAMALIGMMAGISTWFRNDGRLQTADIEEIYWVMARKAVAPDRGRM